MKHTLAIAILTIITLHCQPTQPPAQQPILFANFYVRYVQSEQSLKAEATLKKGLNKETAQTLEPPQTIHFQKQPMEAHHATERGLHYHAHDTSAFQASYQFQFTGNHQETAQITPIPTFLIKRNSSKTTGITIEWATSPLAQGEELTIILNSQDKTTTTTLKGPATKSQAHIPPNQLQGLPPGPLQITLVKKRTTQTQGKSYQAETLIEYYTPPQNTTLTP